MLSPLRPLFAWALLGYAAIDIFFTFANWFKPTGGGFSARAQGADFTTLISVGFPLLAVLIATQLKPVLSTARFVTLTALGELAAVLVFGSMAFLVGLPNAVLHNDAVSMGGFVIFSVAGLAFAALAGFACLRAHGVSTPKLPGEGG
ncbi:MAG TPA: hypothetical protein VFC19_06075 [Candidatus Limnocylindrales bacterium]|nr:hypothetical protein [Candidatus Limnocylindrales bacterium]